MDYDILKEEDGLRVKLTRDDYPDEPYDCGQAPLLRIDRRYHTSAEHVMADERPTGDDARIEEAAAHFGGRLELFEKYLRAYQGATVIKWYGPNNYTDYTYVTYDTPAWVKHIGFDDKCAPLSDYDAAKAVNMDEYIAYLEGETYVYVVEKQVKYIKVQDDGTFDADTTMNTWETVDSCGGFYGHQYAEEAAMEAFNDAKEDV